jgi:thymidylate synthase
MQAYLNLVRHVLDNGTWSENRTGTPALGCFGCFYKVPLDGGYPLLTTKRVRFDSMLRELLWYLSGESHINNLRRHTKIWDAWADGEGRLETAYGRFWRRYPVPESGLPGENWGSRWVSPDRETGTPVFDQIGYIRDSLRDLRLNPADPRKRRLVVTAWHPGNAAQSRLPPCHYTFAFQTTGDRLNCHLTQRSADLALGVPFNLACYSLLTLILARETGWQPGEFAHTLIDAHIYRDHIDGLKEQLDREPYPLPKVTIASKPFEELRFEDFALVDYNHHPAISFPVSV